MSYENNSQRAILHEWLLAKLEQTFLTASKMPSFSLVSKSVGAMSRLIKTFTNSIRDFGGTPSGRAYSQNLAAARGDHFTRVMKRLHASDTGTLEGEYDGIRSLVSSWETKHWSVAREQSMESRFTTYNEKKLK